MHRELSCGNTDKKSGRAQKKSGPRRRKEGEPLLSGAAGEGHRPLGSSGGDLEDPLGKNKFGKQWEPQPAGPYV